MTTTRIPPPALEWVVQRACRAPSLHNTQPWRFTSDGSRIELYADLHRGLPATDPTGRELVISCGAALFNLRLALRGRGFDHTVTLFPEKKDARHLATIELTGRSKTTDAERRALSGLMLRHTHRLGFANRPLDPEVAVLMQQAASDEGASLNLVSDPGSLRRVFRLSNLAALDAKSDERVQSELAAWTPAAGSTRRDGVPTTAYPRDESLTSGDLAPRGFARERGYGVRESRRAGFGQIGILVTETDRAHDWLRAGQALAHLLTIGAAHWVFADLDSQITESPASRAELRRETQIGGHPQLLLHLGYANSAARTPRRPAGEVLSETGTPHTTTAK